MEKKRRLRVLVSAKTFSCEDDFPSYPLRELKKQCSGEEKRQRAALLLLGDELWYESYDSYPPVNIYRKIMSLKNREL